MLLERIYDEDLAQASYVIGCQAKNEAMVVDPRRDIQVYLDLAAKNGMTITHVTETHIHADYLSGTRELAHATGAQIHLSGEGGEDWAYGFEGNLLKDGDTVTLGNITVEAVHTPGHTPEHLSFLVTDGAFADAPGYMLTGDFVFSGDLGRPDLLDEAAGGVDTRFEGAQQLFASLNAKFLTLPDHVQVFPAHGAGSADGRTFCSTQLYCGVCCPRRCGTNFRIRMCRGASDRFTGRSSPEAGAGAPTRDRKSGIVFPQYRRTASSSTCGFASHGSSIVDQRMNPGRQPPSQRCSRSAGVSSSSTHVHHCHQAELNHSICGRT